MNHEEYMRRAMELAAQAAKEGDVPVGCVIVKDGEIVGEGRNRREEHGDATLTRNWRPFGMPAKNLVRGGCTAALCT